MRFFAHITGRAGGSAPKVKFGRSWLPRAYAAVAACFMAAAFIGGAALLPIAAAQAAPAGGRAQAPSQYSLQEVIDSGNNFFGSTSGGLAKAVQEVFKRYGMPNGYIQGQEGSGAFIVGLTYGEGMLYTKNAGDYKVFWQGPSVGFDAGGDGSRVMILVYKLRSIPGLWGRYGGLSGSGYFVAGVGFNVLSRQGVLLVPIRTGVGARLGVNINYLKLTKKATWNPL